LVQLLSLLSEVIRISDSNKKEMQEKSEEAPGLVLMEGSERVTRCASLLVYLLHHVDAPIVLRQAIKCSRVFFKMVNFKNLTLHSL